MISNNFYRDFHTFNQSINLWNSLLFDGFINWFIIWSFVVLKRLRIRDKKIYLLGVIKGLTVERKSVRKAFNKIKPDAIALYLSKNELLGLQSVATGKTKNVPLSRYEVVYARKLAFYAEQDPDKYGKVMVPPPSLLESLKLGQKNKIPVVALDMDDKAYSSTFVDNISTFQLVRHSMRFKKISKKKFNVKTPAEFTYAWDAELTKLKGFKNLETAREKQMANRLVELIKKFNNILAIIELERLEGVFNQLKNRNSLKIDSN